MISALGIHDFHYEQDAHVYRDSEGNVHPSVTQIIRCVGLIDYSHVDVEVLQRKAAIGTDVHAICAEFDHVGDFDPTWLTEDNSGYVAAWQRFRQESGYEITCVEQSGLVNPSGVFYGMTFDRIAICGREKHLIEIKCTAAAHPSWGVQLAAYEMGITNKPRCGYYRRTAVQLKPNGSYRVHGYDDNGDAERFLEALSLTTWKQNHGLWKAA